MACGTEKQSAKTQSRVMPMMGPQDDTTCSLPSGPPDTLKKMMDTTAMSRSFVGALGSGRAAVSSGCSCDDCVALAAHMAVSSNVAAS
jgi:hypothetical protein|eukprot:jgi/Chrpa1/13403/Chrysochromulina_OHIO_Genome00019756-RA